MTDWFNFYFIKIIQKTFFEQYYFAINQPTYLGVMPTNRCGSGAKPDAYSYQPRKGMN